MRLGVDERGVTELMAVVEHIRGLNRVAFGLLLEDDEERGSGGNGGEPLIPFPENDELDDRTREILEQIGEHEGRRIGRPGVPKVWRALARNFHYLEATWGKHEMVFAGGGIEPAAKLAVGLGVSVAIGCRYFIRYFRDALTNAGWDPGGILEVIGVVDHYNSFNTIASGMQIESDIRPEQ
ncbi:MAG: carboxymuconolactone decarboxylase family protein [Nitrospinota bacterium]